jgi:small nuclear ribonucleoprotein B and B'
MSAAPSRSQLAKFLNHRVKVSVGDERFFIGQMLGFDAHSNVILKDCEEHRSLRKTKAHEACEMKRNIGLMVLRGGSVIQIGILGPPPPSGNPMAASTAGIAPEKTARVAVANAPPNLQGLAQPSAGVGLASTKIIPASALPR